MPYRARVFFLAVFAVSCAGEPDVPPAASKSDGGATGDGSGGAGGAAGSGGGAAGSSDARAGSGGAGGGGASGAGGIGGALEAGRDGALTDGSGNSDAPHNAGQLYAYVSGYAPTIAIYQVDDAGAFQTKGSAAATGSPSFLAVNPAHTFLYAVDENNTGKVSAFAIDGATGGLTALNSVSSGGAGPAHVSTDGTGAWVLVANYSSGTVAVLPAGNDGRLSDATDTKSPGQLAHMIVTDPTNKFAFVPCKGSDIIAQFTFDAAQGKLAPNPMADSVHTKQGAGPRHLAFHPSGHYAYVINELDSTINVYDVDSVNGVLAEKQSITTLPDGFQGNNTGAEIWVHPSGSFVYGSNRGDNSIATFTVEADTGKLTLKGHVKTGGNTPRDFALNPAGALLFAANQDSNTVVPFRIDAQTGLPAALTGTITATQPSFVGFVLLGGS